MVLAIFVGGIILGFSLGFATMAVMASRGLRGQSEEAPEMADYLSTARSFRHKVSPALQSPDVLLTP